MSYSDYVASRPGWTGITALACFYLIGLFSIPPIRQWSYEVFQLAHLLMFPVIAMLIAHGSHSIFQWPMLGYSPRFPNVVGPRGARPPSIAGFQEDPRTPGGAR